MSIGPFFKWFGSKWQSAKHYPKPLNTGIIFEPFAGSAGYACNYFWRDVVIYDIDICINKLWKWLIEDASEKDILSIPVDLELNTDIRDFKLSFGQKLLLKNWQRTNNVGDCWTISPWCNKPGQWTESTRYRISQQIGEIKHWKFKPIDYLTSGTYFIDPPYEFNYDYNCRYFNYHDLVTLIRRIPLNSRIIACEAVCPETGEIPTYLSFKENHVSVTSRRKKNDNHHSRELIWTEDR